MLKMIERMELLPEPLLPMRRTFFFLGFLTSWRRSGAVCSVRELSALEAMIAMLADVRMLDHGERRERRDERQGGRKLGKRPTLQAAGWGVWR